MTENGVFKEFNNKNNSTDAETAVLKLEKGVIQALDDVVSSENTSVLITPNTTSKL